MGAVENYVPCLKMKPKFLVLASKHFWPHFCQKIGKNGAKNF